jgi:hypothetical protein
MSSPLTILFGNSKKSPRRSRPKKTWLQVEDLEERSVPTVALSPASLSGHFNLTISDGTNADDTLTIHDNPGVGTQITLNGENFSFSPPAVTLDSITVNLGDGNDTIQIESSAATDPITINLGSGTDTVHVSLTTRNLFNLQNVDVIGGAGNSTLIIDDRNNPNGSLYTLERFRTARGVPMLPGINAEVQPMQQARSQRIPTSQRPMKSD